MTYLLTSAQIRAIETAAITSGQVAGQTLMARAGQAVVAAVRSAWPGQTGPVVVFCGPGNNGGDGYVIARLLAASGRAVTVFSCGDSATPDARLARADWTGPVLPLTALDGPHLSGAPLVIDAMFGTGLARPVAAGVWGALAMAQGSGCPLVAVDMLSGLCADSGRIRAEAGYLDRPASLTVTFDSPRLGHMLGDGAMLSGRLVVADIGLGPWRDAWARSRDTELVDIAAPSGQLAKQAGHKYSHGHALILGGRAGRPGLRRGRRCGRGPVLSPWPAPRRHWPKTLPDWTLSCCTVWKTGRPCPAGWPIPGSRPFALDRPWGGARARSGWSAPRWIPGAPLCWMPMP